MADKKHILTYAGLKQYEDELQNLKVVKRKEVAQKIKEAREQGDLSENAEYDAAKDEEMEFYIVGSTEANSLQNKISNESPVGRALIGKVVGECVDVETQAGDIQYKVLEIQRVS